MQNQLFFVYRGSIKVNAYIPRLSELGRLEIIGAFPERDVAVEFALMQEFPAVVVERGFVLQGVGDDNNLISECEWENSQENEQEPPSPAPAPEPEPEELTGSVEIVGNIQIGETLTADVSGLDGNGTISYQWGRCDTPESVRSFILGQKASAYQLSELDANKYITVMVSREGYDGIVYSEPVGPIL